MACFLRTFSANLKHSEASYAQLRLVFGNVRGCAGHDRSCRFEFKHFSLLGFLNHGEEVPNISMFDAHLKALVA